MGITDPTYNNNNGANTHHFDVDEAARRLQIHILARQALTRAIEQQRQYVSMQQQQQSSQHRTGQPPPPPSSSSTVSTAARQQRTTPSIPSSASSSSSSIRGNRHASTAYSNTNTHSVRTNAATASRQTSVGLPKAPANRNMKPPRSKDPESTTTANTTAVADTSSSMDPIYISIPIVAVGATGIRGMDGQHGATGIQGPAGKDGQQGATGIQGPAGKDGRQGATGIQGIAGKDGRQGATGLQGIAGKDGRQGATGIQGIAGKDGRQGATGLQGIAGKDGRQGATGIQGIAGRDGQQGATGIQGIAGKDGRQGATGIQGIAGRDGRQGATGIQGIAGCDGQQGATGLKGDTGAGLYQSRTIFVDPKYATGAFNQMEYRDLVAQISAVSLESSSSSSLLNNSFESLNDLIESSSRPVASLQHALYLLLQTYSATASSSSLSSSLSPPSPDTPWVIYFAPGRHTIGHVRLAPNIYLCGTPTVSTASDAATILEGTITVDPTVVQSVTTTHRSPSSSYRDVGGLCDLTLQTTFAQPVWPAEENNDGLTNDNDARPLILSPAFCGTFHVSRVHFDTTYHIAPPIRPTTVAASSSSSSEPNAVVQNIVRIVSGSLQSQQCVYSLNTQASYHEASASDEKKNTNVDCIFHLAPKPKLVAAAAAATTTTTTYPSTLTAQGDTIMITTHNGYADTSVPRVAVTFVEEGTASTCTQISQSTITFNIRNPFGVGHITPINGTVTRHDANNSRVRMCKSSITNSRVTWSDTTDYSNVVANAKQNAFTLVWNDAPESEVTASQVVTTVDSPILDPAIRHIVYMCNDAPLVPNEIYSDVATAYKKKQQITPPPTTWVETGKTPTITPTDMALHPINKAIDTKNALVAAHGNTSTIMSGPWVHIMDCSWTCPTINRTSSTHSSSSVFNELSPWVVPRMWIGSAMAAQEQQQREHRPQNHRLRYRITSHSGTLNTSAGLAFNTVTFRTQQGFGNTNNNNNNTSNNDNVYTVTDKDGTVLVDATNAHGTIILAPSNVHHHHHLSAGATTSTAHTPAVLPGRIVVIRRIDNSVANKLFIRASPGEYIETQPSMILDIQESVMIQSTGHGMWRCLSKKSNNAFMLSFVANGEYVLSYMNNQPTNCHYIGLGCNSPQFASVAFILPISGDIGDTNNHMSGFMNSPSSASTSSSLTSLFSQNPLLPLQPRQRTLNNDNNNNNNNSLAVSMGNSFFNTNVLNTIATRMSVQATNHPRNLLFFSGVSRVDVAFDIAMAPFGSNQPTSFSVEPVIVSFTGENQICTGMMPTSNTLTTIASNQLVALRARIVNVVYTDVPVPVQMTLTFSNAGVRLVQISE